MDQGWIKLHRKIMDSAIWNNPNLFKMASYLIMRANFKDTSVMVGNIKVDLKRGQFITGRKSLGKELKTKATTAWLRLNALKNDNFCSIESNNRFSIITIINYELYQGEDVDNDNKNDSKTGNKMTTECQRNDTDKNVKKGKNEKKKTLKPTFQVFQTEAQKQTIGAINNLASAIAGRKKI